MITVKIELKMLVYNYEKHRTSHKICEIVALQPGNEKVAWYRLFAHVRNIRHIFHTIVLYTYITPCTECYTNLEYGPVAMRVVLMPGNLRLVTRSTISDTKRDTTTTTLLTTILLPCTEL